MAFKAYCAMDIFSRKVVGSRVEEREVDDLAAEMFEIAFGEHGIPGAVHADSGAAMRSSAVADLLAAYGVTKTHNRPRVSNDNPFSKSEFRTMKYRPGYPRDVRDPRGGQGAPGRVRRLVQRQPQALGHRPVLAERGPRRQLARGPAAPRRRPAGLLRRTPRAIQEKAPHPGPAGLVGINQPKPEQQPQPA